MCVRGGGGLDGGGGGGPRGVKWGLMAVSAVREDMWRVSDLIVRANPGRETC